MEYLKWLVLPAKKRWAVIQIQGVEGWLGMVMGEAGDFAAAVAAVLSLP
jgi:hypothetical protein